MATASQQAPETPACSYDEMPYESNPFYYTHPVNLATLGTLAGLQPPAPDTCRVLELGCASGGNLMPMAYSLPESRLLGIDLSPRQIATGQRIVDALGIRNVDLRALSILDVDDDLGSFDYIICHGVYSWVPPVVQDKILDICSRLLTPQGVAYVSYNTYPGWHARRMVREMLCFHTRRYADSQVQVKQAREFLDFLIRSVRIPEGIYAYSLKEEAEMLRDEPDSYLLHEHLEEHNEPVYFRDFAERVAAKGLQCIGEAKFGDSLGSCSPDVHAALSAWTNDPVEVEQYLDFIRERTFRRTVLCRAELSLTRPALRSTIERLYLTSHAKPVSATPDVCSDAVEEFRTPDRVSVSSNHPMAKAALVELFNVYPTTLSFDELWERVQARLAAAPPLEGLTIDRPGLAQMLFSCGTSGLVDVHVQPLRYARHAGERPSAFPLALECARTTMRVPTLRHHLADLTPFDLFVLRHLDGRHDRAALLKALEQAVAGGVLELTSPSGGESETSPAGLPPLSDLLELSLRRLTQCALVLA